MSKIKKLIALTLALAMVLSVSAFAGSYSENTYADADKINADCEEAVELLYALDIMVGDGKNFNPESAVTRAEMAKMIYVILNYGDDDKAVTYTGAKFFTDVEAGYWAEGYINYCAATKLIAGRGDNKFDPTAPVTTAEAAKMMLTAIGYSAEARGYVGANWDKNVLADASIIGLLSGYKSNVNTYAPRQWVAVMFENLLLKAFTFETMVPGFSGLLTSGYQANVEYYYPSMGQKYYGLNDEVGYLYATDTAYIDQILVDDKETTTTADDEYSTYAADGWLLFSNGVTVKSSALGYMDLGQQFRVIYKDGGKTVYSIRNTGVSEVGDAIQYDVSYETIRATSSNEAYNQYEFTFGDLTATFEENTIPYLVIAKRGNTAKVEPRTVTAKAMTQKAGLKFADEFRAIDKNADGEIDYIIVKDYSYAQVTKTAEHKSYGEYFTATGVDGNTFMAEGFVKETQWYLDDVVNTDDTIEVGNVIKVVYNPDNGKYDVEVMAVEEPVTYEKRNAAKGIYTLGGADYVIAEDGWKSNNEDVLVAGNLKDDMKLVADGELVVLVKKVDSDYTDLADINAQLVMVTDIYYDVYGGTSAYNRVYVDYMTIDGEHHKEVRYANGKDTASKTSDDANVNYTEMVDYLAENQRLFVLVESGDSVYMKKLEMNPDNSKDILDYAESLLTGYYEGEGAVDTEDNTFESDFIDSDNEFFVSYKTSASGSMKYAVLCLDDLGEGIQENAYLQGLYKTKRTIDTYLAGHIYLGVLDLYEATGYLYSTSGDVWSEDDDAEEFTLYDVVFDNGDTAESIVITNSAVKANCLYSYSYEKVNGEKIYTLTLIDEKTEDNSKGNRVDFYTGGVKYEIVNAIDTGKVFAEAAGYTDETLTIDDNTIVVLKKVVWENQENLEFTGKHDDAYDCEYDEIAFVTFEDLIAEEDDEFVNFIAGGSDETYDYESDYYYVGAKGDVEMLYVIVHAVAQDAND